MPLTLVSALVVAVLLAWLILLRRRVAAQAQEILQARETRGAEEALRESERMLLQSQLVGRLGSYRFDVASGTWTGSQVLDEIFGITDPDFPRDVDGWLSIIHEDERVEMFAYLMEDILGAKQTFDRVYRIVRPSDGGERWVHGLGDLTLTEEGEVVEMVGTIQDISEQRQAEEGLRLFRALVDQTTDLIEVVDPETLRLLDVNDTACKELGYSKEELLSMTVRDIDPALDSAFFQDSTLFEGLLRDIEASGVLTWDGVHRRKDGSTFPVEVNITLVRLDREYGVAVVRNTTARREAEQRQALLSAAVDQATECVIITDLDGTIQYVNPAFETATGYTSEEAVGRNPRILKSGKQENSFYESLWDAITQGRAWTGDFINKRKDGTFFHQLQTIFPVADAWGTTTNYVSIGRDVTHERELEAQLRQAQKMEAVGALASGVAHDFNNILTTILATTNLMLANTDEDAEDWSDLREIEQAAGRAAGLTRQLLAFGRQQVLEPRAANLTTVVADLETMLRRIIGEEIDFQTALEPALGTVWADPGQLEQVIMNLVVNARDAVTNEGAITIRTGNVDIDEAFAAAHVGSKPGRYVMVSVSDDGAGMDAETRARIFEPFFTTKGLDKGTGLGLAMVYGVVTQSQGYVSVDSGPGEGTTFTIYLPRYDVESDDSTPVMAAADSLRGSETLLLAEDDEHVRGLAERILRSYGYRVLSAATGMEALAVAASYAGSIDLLVTDVVMPGWSGRELAERLEAQRGSIKTLYVSGYPAEITDEHGVLTPQVAFLPKPFTREGLGRKVREVLDSD